VDDAERIDRLLCGDEQVFRELLAAHQSSMLRVAESFVSERGLAEDVVQETWAGVLRGIERFEGRSSLTTWIYSILINQARTCANRERRTVSFDPTELDHIEDPSRFAPDGSWAQPPVPFTEEIEERLARAPMLAHLNDALAELPATQRVVVTLRDVEQLDAQEVCDILGITAVNQRVLLHRARASLRRTLEALVEGGE